MDLTARHLDTLSNSELASHMGWSDANARGPGVDAEASIAVGLLREGLPEAIEKGIVRVVDGPEYNIPTSTLNNPNMGPSPALSIMWHAMASTSSLKVFDTEALHWRVRCPTPELLYCTAVSLHSPPPSILFFTANELWYAIRDPCLGYAIITNQP